MKQTALLLIPALFLTVVPMSGARAQGENSLNATARGAHAQPAFMQGLDDIPLMPGLEELPARTILFDKPEGRYVEVTAAGTAHAAAIHAYYAALLPSLGWRAERDVPGRFSRDSEILTLSVERQRDISVTRFTLEPR